MNPIFNSFVSLTAIVVFVTAGYKNVRLAIIFLFICIMVALIHIDHGINNGTIVCKTSPDVTFGKNSSENTFGKNSSENTFGKNSSENTPGKTLWDDIANNNALTAYNTASRLTFSNITIP